jgi:ribosomal protein S21
MRGTPEVSRLVPVGLVEQEIDAHLKSLRRKLERAARLGEPVDGLRARIHSEEALLRRMRAFQVGRRETRRPE